MNTKILTTLLVVLLPITEGKTPSLDNIREGRQFILFSQAELDARNVNDVLFYYPTAQNEAAEPSIRLNIQSRVPSKPLSSPRFIGNIQQFFFFNNRYIYT